MVMEILLFYPETDLKDSRNSSLQPCTKNLPRIGSFQLIQVLELDLWFVVLVPLKHFETLFKSSDKCPICLIQRCALIFWMFEFVY